MSSLPAVRTQQHSLIMLSLPEIQERAQILVKSGLLPESITTAEQAIVIALKGQELGLPMLQSFEDLFVIKGKVGMFTRLMITRYLDRGHRYQIVEATAKRCTVKFTRRDGQIYEHAVTIEEAQGAKWDQTWDKEKGAWKPKPTWSNPRVMLMWACFRNGIKFFAPDVLDPDMVEADLVDGQVLMPDDEQGGDIVEGSAQSVPVASAPVKDFGAREKEAPRVAIGLADEVERLKAELEKATKGTATPADGPADWTDKATQDAFTAQLAEYHMDGHDALMAFERATGQHYERVGQWKGSLSAAMVALCDYMEERDGKGKPAQQGLFA